MPFAPVHFASGPIVVTWNSIQLGYSEDGVRGTITPYTHPVHSDDFGGRAGPPADEQLMAGIANVQIAFTKYVKAEMDKLTSFQKNGVAGVFPPIGTFLRQDGKGAPLLLDGLNDDWTFTYAVLKGGQEINSGTKFRTYVVGWECWINQTDYNLIAQAQNRTLFTISS
jgi:hypothetical protein